MIAKTTYQMDNLQQQSHPMFGQLFADLKDHAMLTGAGLDSEQASEIVFNKLRLDDPRSSVSSCCRATVMFDGLGPFCTECAESCNLVPNESV